MASSAASTSASVLAKPREKRTALGGDYYILTLGVPSVLVECGFLSNKAEEALLMQETYREQIAESIVKGVLDWQKLHMEKPQPLAAQDRSDEPTAE